MNYNYNASSPYSSNIPKLLGQGQPQGFQQVGARLEMDRLPVGQSSPNIWGLPHEKGHPMNDLEYNTIAKQAMHKYRVPMQDGIGSIFSPPEVRELSREDATKYLDQYYSSYNRFY